MIKTIDKLNYWLTLIIRLSLVVAIFGSLYTFNWMALFVSVLTLILTFAIKGFEKRYEIDIPTEFEIFIIIFIYCSLYLGEVHNYYVKFWWWDLILHGFSAMALGIIGFVLMLFVYQGGKIRTNIFWISIFAFSFAVAMGTIWEVFEFSIDQLFGANMQKSGLTDTMWDLIIDCLGAMISSLSGYFYFKGKTNLSSIKSFIDYNPLLFKKNK